MKAIVFTEYGSPDVLTMQEVEKPVPAVNEVLIKVATSTVNFGDTFVRNFKTVTPRSFTMPGILWLPTRLTIGIRTPGKRTPGSEFVGEVVSIGTDVTRYKIGDRVFGYRGMQMGA
ncbi:MAG: alcohol dehydrogenase catalytic domain-containing protein, partial [Aggregatilineales bacterium]